MSEAIGLTYKAGRDGRRRSEGGALSVVLYSTAGSCATRMFKLTVEKVAMAKVSKDRASLFLD